MMSHAAALSARTLSEDSGSTSSAVGRRRLSAPAATMSHYAEQCQSATVGDKHKAIAGIASTNAAANEQCHRQSPSALHFHSNMLRILSCLLCPWSGKELRCLRQNSIPASAAIKEQQQQQQQQQMDNFILEGCDIEILRNQTVVRAYQFAQELQQNQQNQLQSNATTAATSMTTSPKSPVMAAVAAVTADGSTLQQLQQQQIIGRNIDGLVTDLIKVVIQKVLAECDILAAGVQQEWRERSIAGYPLLRRQIDMNATSGVSGRNSIQFRPESTMCYMNRLISVLQVCSRVVILTNQCTATAIAIDANLSTGSDEVEMMGYGVGTHQRLVETVILDGINSVISSFDTSNQQQEEEEEEEEEQQQQKRQVEMKSATKYTSGKRALMTSCQKQALRALLSITSDAAYAVLLLGEVAVGVKASQQQQQRMHQIQASVVSRGVSSKHSHAEAAAKILQSM